MDLLMTLVGSAQGYAIAHFLSVHRDNTFRAISEAFRCQFPPEERANVAIAIALLLRRRPDSTTQSARMIGTFVLFDGFHFHRVSTHHMFGPVFVTLLRNEPIPWKPAIGLRPFSMVEHRFLRHLLQTGSERVMNLTPQYLLTHPEAMEDLVDFAFYERRVISFAIRHLSIVPFSTLEVDSVSGLLADLQAKSAEDYFQELETIGDDMQFNTTADEPYAFYLLYRRVNNYMFPCDDSYFVPGGLIRDQRYVINDNYLDLARSMELNVIANRLPILSSYNGHHHQSAAPMQGNGMSAPGAVRPIDAAPWMPCVPSARPTALLAPLPQHNISRYAPGAPWEKSHDEEGVEVGEEEEEEEENEGTVPMDESSVGQVETGPSSTNNGEPPVDGAAELDELSKLLHSARLQTLPMVKQQHVLKLFTKRTETELLSLVDEDHMEGLIRCNPMLAVSALCRFVECGQVHRYLDRLSGMQLSLNILDVLSRVTMSVALPAEFLRSFLCGCYEACKKIEHGDSVHVSRMVKLVCAFTESLVVRKLVDVEEIKYEALPFCIYFNGISEVLALYRMLIAEDG